MKKFNPFRTVRQAVPALKTKDKSREVLFTQPFGRVQLHFWDVINPGERFEIKDNTKLLTTPFVGPQYSSINMRTRYFAVPMRKAVPHFEEFILSEPSDNVLEYHTYLYDILRACCYDSRISPTWRGYMYQSLQPDGLANYVGIPWVLDQLCMLITGKDIAYMEEWTAILLEEGGQLEPNGNITSFRELLVMMFNVVPLFFPFSSLDYLFVWTSGNYDSQHPTVYQPAPFGITGTINNNVYYIHIPAFFGASGLDLSVQTWEGFLQYVLEDGGVFSTTIRHMISDLTDTGDYVNPSGGVASGDLKSGKFGYLLKADRDSDHTDYFLGQRIRLAPFCAYKKVQYDWFTDMRVNDDEFEEFYNYVTDNVPESHYVRYTDTFTFTSHITQQVVTRPILPWLFTNFVVDYQKDYFTTCAHEPQAGPDIVIGPNGRLPLMFDVTSVPPRLEPAAPMGEASAIGDEGELKLVGLQSNAQLGRVWAQINESDEITPIKLRWQQALQRFNESRNRSGYFRYTDFVLGQYGIRVPDPYLLRSVYLGGYRTSVNTNPVVAQADGQTEDTSAMLADIGAYGSGRAYGPTIKGYVKEHVIIVGVNYIVPQNYYYQGLSTKLTDVHLLDYPMWQFANVGEQPVKNREIFLGAAPSETFGYQKRYSDKFFANDELHGEFITNLRHWHTGRKFLSQPSLNQDLLSLRGQDGHDDILVVRPSVSMPFRIIKYINFYHHMCV